MRKLAILLVFVSVAAFSAPAEASSILVTGAREFTVYWLYNIPGAIPGTTPMLKAQATFKITNWTLTPGVEPDYFDLTINQIKNTTAATPDIKARFTAFGFGLTPDATSISNPVVGTYFTKIGFGAIPSYSQVDICSWAGPTCQGGAGDRIAQGSAAADSVSMRINGSFPGGVTFYPFAVKFQTDKGSYEFGDSGYCDATNPNCLIPDQPIPEPASMVLFGTGLIAATALRRFRRKQ